MRSLKEYTFVHVLFPFFAGQYIHIFVALALLGCTKAGPINEIHLRDWTDMEGWMKGRGGQKP